jgi:hypothetical protein
MDFGHAQTDKLTPFIDNFLLPFTRGDKPDPQASAAEWPYSGSPVDVVQTKEHLLNGLVVPAYDDYVSAEEGGRWLGGMAGWIVIRTQDSLCPDPGIDLETSWAALIQYLRTFVRRVREANMRALLGSYARQSTPEPPLKFFKDKLSRVIGWDATRPGIQGDWKLGVPSSIGVSALPDTIWADNQQELPAQNGLLIQQFLEGLQAIHTNHLHGRQQASSESYQKTAHQLRKLTSQIAPGGTEEDYRALRQYFALTFLHSKNLEGNERKRFVTDVDRNSYGPKEFLKATSLRQLLDCAAKFAQCLLPMIDKLHTASPVAEPAPKVAIDFEAGLERFYLLPCDDQASVDGEDPLERLKVRAFVYCELVAVWLNILEHTPEGGRVTVFLEQDDILVFHNDAPESPQGRTSGGSVERSVGTRQTLEYYLAVTPGQINRASLLEFSQQATCSVFTTRLPLPRKEVFRANP